MGFWQWQSGGSTLQRTPSRHTIWLSTAAKFRGICGHIRECSGASRTIVLAHFQSTLDELQSVLSNAKIEFEFRTDPLSPREAWQSAGRDDGPPVVAMLSRSLKLDEPAVGESRALELISAERHFLRAHDERVAAFCAGMPGSRKAHFHMSLDDSVMQIFGGKWVADTLRRLGQGEDEPIESAMVSRRLLQAQERFSQRAIADEQADSPAEWLRVNAPDMAG